MGEATAAPGLGQAEAGDDEAALVRAARTVPTAFDMLHARYGTRLYRYLRTRVATDEDAADLTQQVFLQAWAALPRYQEQGLPFAAWLFRIARNAATNAVRGRRATVPWEALSDAPDEAVTADPERSALRREALGRLRALLDGLDSDKRELLALRFAAGLTAREIAATIGEGEAAVKRRLSRTIRALKEAAGKGDDHA